MYARLKTAGGTYVPDADILFGDDIKLSLERESEEMYRRLKVSGTFTFVRDAYSAVVGSSMNDLLTLELYTDALIATAPFRKGSCEISQDDRTAKINPQSIDKYEKLLNGKDNKYNITRIGAESESVDMTKRTILQLYFEHDNKITNIIGNTSYEVDASPSLAEGETIERKYHFAVYKRYRRLYFKTDVADLKYLEGGYIGEDGAPYILVKEDGTYRLQSYNGTWRFIDNAGNIVNYNGNPLRTATQSEIVDPKSVPSVKYRYRYLQGSSVFYAWDGNEFSFYNNPLPRLGEIEGEVAFSLYARYLHDKDGINGAWLRADDITDENLNYRYVSPYYLPYALFPDLRVLNNLVTSEEPTEWGQLDNGRYFTKPEIQTSIFRDGYVVPIGRYQWGPSSFWFINDLDLADYEDGLYNDGFTLKDAYSLRSILKNLVIKASDGEITDVASDFLFSDINPFDGSYAIPQKYFITPITNIKKTYYDQAAQKGDITLNDVLSMLKTVFNCYWHLEESEGAWVMRIEHRIWYYKGGRYSGTISPEDLTGYECPLPNKRWLDGTNTYKYVLDAPKRIEFAWAESCTEYFNGYAIDIKDAYLEKGKTDKRNASNFVSDVDLIIAQPSSLGDDVMVLLHTDLLNKVNITTVEPKGLLPSTGSKLHPLARLQNGSLSFLMLERIFLNRPLGGNNYEIDGEIFQAVQEFGYPLLRMKHQTIQFPKTDFDENKLVQTDLGAGEIDKVEYDLSSGMANLELLLGI